MADAAPMTLTDDTAVEMERLRAEIQRTRLRVGSTIDAIHQRLTPRELVAQARESVKDAAGELAGRSMQKGAEVAAAARRHPIPASMVFTVASWALARLVKRGAAGGPWRVLLGTALSGVCWAAMQAQRSEQRHSTLDPKAEIDCW